jgi:hypothetical protein
LKYAAADHGRPGEWREACQRDASLMRINEKLPARAANAIPRNTWRRSDRKERLRRPRSGSVWLKRRQRWKGVDCPKRGRRP